MLVSSKVLTIDEIIKDTSQGVLWNVTQMWHQPLGYEMHITSFVFIIILENKNLMHKLYKAYNQSTVILPQDKNRSILYINVIEPSLKNIVTLFQRHFLFLFFLLSHAPFLFPSFSLPIFLSFLYRDLM